jgi:uncharacterized protein
MRIGIISDTHGQLHPAIAEHFAGVDHIIHAGDIGDVTILDRLRAIAPVTAVAGNIDGFECGDAGLQARVALGGLEFYALHILDRPGRPSKQFLEAMAKKNADVIIFGHSHLPHNEKRGNHWFFNPASAGPRRFDYPRSIGIFEQLQGRWSAHHIALDDRSEGALQKYMNALSKN